ncbi:class I SAM-dependent methyltransferase [Pseudothermotoga thermarum]|uniref:class I SAM-dependent methyltransferase n=1 Tax=Pseudothermotoga thermarum TaxID=119394 RepID=UPI0002EA4278|nr:methyltransferase domain-containing protein [Pseudothermotoga thermarum]
MEEQFNQIADQYDQWFETEQGKVVKELELKALLEILGDLQGKTLLEVGIGTGLFAMEFRKLGAKVYGIDPAEKMLEIARSRGFEVKFGYGEQIPYPDNSFDITLSMTSMENSKSPEKFLQEMVRVTKPNGKVVVAVLNLFSLYGIVRKIKGLFNKDDLFREMHFYTYWELNRLMKKYLCDVSTNSSVFFGPFAPKFILKNAHKFENFGRKYLKPFGALLVSAGRKC